MSDTLCKENEIRRSYSRENELKLSKPKFQSEHFFFFTNKVLTLFHFGLAL